MNLRSGPGLLNVRYGHKADITITLNHVRFRGKSVPACLSEPGACRVLPKLFR
jgi:hypothetical protein